VDEYIASAPHEVQDKLRTVREAIKKAAPEAEEDISYGMPSYYHGGRLAWFGLSAHHIGLYLRPPVIQQNSRILEGYGTTKSSVHLPLDKDIPVSLVTKLVRARLRLDARNR
jgi:uncharacterized protein YdhG (YjbR/CyaY superfamily)